MKDIRAKVDWKKGDGLVPAIIQDSATGTVLMLGFMNREALNRTLKTGNVWFFSRSRKCLWMKGGVSKHILRVASVDLDCDQDTLLLKVHPSGPVCHRGMQSCFGRGNVTSELRELFTVIESRKHTPLSNSYTSALFRAGADTLCLKVAEEALETIQAAKKQTRIRLIEETTDLLYHLFVLLAAKKIQWKEIEGEVRKRKQ